MTSASIAASDSGTATGAWLNLSVSEGDTDTGSGSDTANVGGLLVTDTDSGSLTDDATSAHEYTDTDTGTFTENAYVLASISDHDSVAVTDGSPLLRANTSDSDTGEFTDVGTEAWPVVTDTDDGSFRELGQTYAVIHSTDQGIFTDTAPRPNLSHGATLAGSIPHAFVPPAPHVTVVASSAWGVRALSVYGNRLVGLVDRWTLSLPVFLRVEHTGTDKHRCYDISVQRPEEVAGLTAKSMWDDGATSPAKHLANTRAS